MSFGSPTGCAVQPEDRQTVGVVAKSVLPLSSPGHFTRHQRPQRPALSPPGTNVANVGTNVPAPTSAVSSPGTNVTNVPNAKLP